MAVWLVRAGRRGEREAFAFEHGVAAIGWDDLPDLTTFKDREQLAEAVLHVYPTAHPQLRQNHVAQTWTFSRTIAVGDVIAMPLKGRSVVSFGEVTGPYRYESNNPSGSRHVRPVKWGIEIPRERIDQDLLYSLGSALTVCRIERNDAERRLRALIAGKRVDAPSVPEQGSPNDIHLEPEVSEWGTENDNVSTRPNVLSGSPRCTSGER